MRLRRKNKNCFLVIAFVLIVFSISIGYASIATGLYINGTTDIPSSSWSVHFANLHITDGSCMHGTETHPYQPVTLDENLTSITYAVSFLQPGEFYEFTFDVVNDGSLDAKIESVLKNISTEYNDYSKIFDYTIIDVDTGLEPARGDVLAANSTKHLKLRVEVKSSATKDDMPLDEASLKIIYKLNYVQV